MSGFTKLHASLISSSIWNEDNITRVVWITMLAMADENGFVGASIGGLAHQARVTQDECETALKKLKSPDKDSRTKEFEGRRISEADGGFVLLNYPKHREKRDPGHRKVYMKEYMKEYRDKCKQPVNNVNNVKPSKPRLAQAEAEAEADKEIYKEKQPSALQLRLGGIFKRRESTIWSKQELKALSELEKLYPFPEDIEMVENFHKMEIPKDKDHRRTSLLTLLRHWNEEVDRAQKYVKPNFKEQINSSKQLRELEEKQAIEDAKKEINGTN